MLRMTAAFLCLVAHPTVAAGFLPPVSGDWQVVQGPPCPAIGNYHCNTINQRFAYDLVPIALDGTPLNCIGMPIRAPTGGTVISVLDGVPNHVVGSHPAGNHIVIQRAPNAYVLLAHFSPGTISVAEGATVTTGQKIGACGNSGRSSAPHLHLQVQQHPLPMKWDSPGLPMRFQQVNIWSPQARLCTPRAAYLMQRGDIICQQK